MKIKNKFYLFAMALFFLSVFFVKVDGVINVAYASCASDCQDMAAGDEGLYGECYSSYDCYSVDNSGTIDTSADSNADTPADEGSWWGENMPTWLGGDSYSDSDVTTYVGCMKAWNDEEYCSDRDDAPVRDTYFNSDTSTYAGCMKAWNNDSDYCADKSGSPTETAKTNADAIAAKSAQAGAAQRASDTTRAIDSACRVSADSQACRAAREAAVKADQELRDADAKLTAAMIKAAQANGVTDSNTSIPGLFLDATGMLANECRDSNGNLSTGCPTVYPPTGYTNPYGGLPVSYDISSNYTAGPGGTYNPAKCGANFSEIGGVCFPTNTGLANPQGGIGQILSSLFSWLLGIFTTLAILAFVISGIQYFLASGDESMAKKAKENATNAIIGIIVGLSGFIIFQAIAMALSGQSVLF